MRTHLLAHAVVFGAIVALPIPSDSQSESINIRVTREHTTGTSPTLKGLTRLDYVQSPEKVVADASNTNPIVIKAPEHGYRTGDLVRIKGVIGNPAANGDWQITVNGPDTFRLNNSAGNGQFKLGGGKVLAVPIQITFDPNKTPPVFLLAKLKIEFFDNVLHQKYVVNDKTLCRGMSINNYETLQKWTEIHEATHVEQIKAGFTEVLSGVTFDPKTGDYQVAYEGAQQKGKKQDVVETLRKALENKYSDITGKGSEEYATGALNTGYEGEARQESCDGFMRAAGNLLKRHIRDAEQALAEAKKNREAQGKLLEEAQQHAQKALDAAKDALSQKGDCRKELSYYAKEQQLARDALTKADQLRDQLSNLLQPIRASLDEYDRLKISSLLEELQRQQGEEDSHFAARALFPGYDNSKFSTTHGDKERKTYESELKTLRDGLTKDTKRDGIQKTLENAKNTADKAKENCPESNNVPKSSNPEGSQKRKTPGTGDQSKSGQKKINCDCNSLRGIIGGVEKVSCLINQQELIKEFERTGKVQGHCIPGGPNAYPK